MHRPSLFCPVSIAGAGPLVNRFLGLSRTFSQAPGRFFAASEFLSAIPGRIVRVRAGYAQKARKEVPGMKEKNRNQNENQNEQNNENHSENREQNQNRNQNQQNRSQR